MATNDLQTQADTYQSKLRSSPTAYAPGVTPTKRDMSLSATINAINKKNAQIQSDRTRTMWYGPNNASSDVQEVAPPDGWFIGGLKAAQRPLNAIAGAAQYAIGQGTDRTLAGSINKSMKSGLTFGNILEQNNVPAWARIPLGFSLDVMFDPVNWVTMGTAAVIPRTVVGAIKGGAAGAKEGLVSNVAKKAWYTGRFTGLNKAFPEATDRLAARAMEGAAKYDELIGSSIKDRVNKGILTGIAEEIPGLRNIIPKPGETFKAIEKFATKTPRGEKIWDAFRYSVPYASKVADTLDLVKRGYSGLGIQATRAKDAAVDFQDVSDFFNPAATVLRETDEGDELIKVWKTLEDGSSVVDREALEGAVTVADNVENARKLLDALRAQGHEAFVYDAKLLEKAYRSIEPGRTGVAWYDKFLDKLETTTIGDIKGWFRGDFRLGSGDMKQLAKIRETEAEARFTARQAILDKRSVASDPLTMKRLEVEKENIKRHWNNIATRRANANWRPFEDALIGERNAKAVFKLMKVPFNLSSHLVANLGNAIMMKMIGLPIESAAFRHYFLKAARIVRGREGSEGLREAFLNEINSFVKMMTKNPTRFRDVFGQGADDVLRQINALEARVPGTFDDDMSAEAMARGVENIIEGLRRAEAITPKILAKEAEMFGEAPKLPEPPELARPIDTGLSQAEKIEVRRMQTPMEAAKKAAEEGEPLLMAERAGPLAEEIQVEGAPFVDKMLKEFERLAEEHPKNQAYLLLNWIAHKMPKAYEQHDQTWKLASSMFMTQHGLTEAQVNTISRFINIDVRSVDEGGDIVKIVKSIPETIDEETGEIIRKARPLPENLYLLDPLKASEISMEAFMNYAAMPDFVRVMRALPIVGSPFYSFPYAMAAKTAKTAIHNPAVFNKVAFLMSEFSGLRTPEEKKALQEKYNLYLNSPTVVRIFGMWNTDVKNWVPYYTMNMLQPSERKYGDSFEAQMLKFTDKLPILQDPAGQVIKDYFIQPWILSGTKDIPQGQFGQPILPYFDPKTGRRIDPSLGTKAFYAGRTALESFVPGTAGVFGPAFAGLSQKTLETLPLGYGVRGAAYAAQGKTSLGVISKENKMQKTIRALASRLGLPLYTLDTTKTNIKK